MFGQLQCETWLLAFLPEQHELQRILQLLHKPPDPGAPAVTQPQDPAGQQLSQRLCRCQGLRLQDLGVSLYQHGGQLGIRGPGCRDGRECSGHWGHPEQEGDYAVPE